MKTISLLLAAVLLGTVPTWAAEETVQTTQNQVVAVESNKDLVELTRASFNEGEFDDFLKEMDKEYQSGVENHELEGLVAFLKQTGKFSSEPKSPIQEAYTQQLLALVENEEETLLVEKIRSSATPLKDDVAKAFQTIAKLQMKEPGTGDNIDQNRVIDIRLEHLFKTYHLGTKDLDPEELREKKQKQIALEMDCFKRLVLVSESFKDEALKKDIAVAAENLDLYLAKTRDSNDLLALYIGIRAPQNDLEQQVTTIIQSAHEKAE